MWRVRQPTLDQLETELNLCADHGYKVLEVQFPELDAEDASLLGERPTVLVMSKKHSDAPADHDELEWLREIAGDTARVICLAQNSMVNRQDCEECVTCRARLLLETYPPQLVGDTADREGFEDTSVEESEGV